MGFKVKLGWKVVHPINGMLLSSNFTHTKYFVGRWTHRLSVGYGPLCVFTSRKTARAFKQEHTRVYRCWYKPSKDQRVWSPWNGSYPLLHLPKGKALAERVMLLWRD